MTCTALPCNSEQPELAGLFNSLVFVVDVIDRPCACLQLAIDLARRSKAKLTLAYLLPPIPPLPPDPAYAFLGPKEYQNRAQAEAEGILEHLIQRQFPRDIRARAVIGRGDAAMEITRIVKIERADVLAICPGYLTRRPYFLFASVAERLMRLAACPVLVLPPPSSTELSSCRART